MVHIRICNFFFVYQFFSFFHCVPSASLLESAQIERGVSIRPFIRPSVRPSVHPCVWTCCVGCLLASCSCFLLPVSVSGRGHSRKREQYAGQAGTVIWLCTHSWSVHGFQQQHYFRRSSTHTDPSDALAPTLSPAAFQQTSKIPPVPL